MLALLILSIPPEVERAAERVAEARNARSAVSHLERAVEAAAADPAASADVLVAAIDAQIARRIEERRAELIRQAAVWQVDRAWINAVWEARTALNRAVESGQGMREASEALGEAWRREVSGEVPEEQAEEFDATVAELDADLAEMRAALAPLGVEPASGSLRDRLLRAKLGEVFHHFGPEEALEDWRWNRGVDLYHREEFRMPDEGGPEILEHLALLNEHREMAGRRRLALHAGMVRCAAAHSEVMREEGQIFHDGSDGTPSGRASRAGFRGLVGENVAMSGERPEEPFWQWVGSQGHHQNMLRVDYNGVGVGRAGGYWTQIFGVGAAPGALQRCIEQFR